MTKQTYANYYRKYYKKNKVKILYRQRVRREALKLEKAKEEQAKEDQLRLDRASGKVKTTQRLSIYEL